jgi:hypothetical protein
MKTIAIVLLLMPALAFSQGIYVQQPRPQPGQPNQSVPQGVIQTPQSQSVQPQTTQPNASNTTRQAPHGYFACLNSCMWSVERPDARVCQDQCREQ